MSDGSPSTLGKHLFAWAELVRLPNVFTALADVAMGILVTRGTMTSGIELGLLAATTLLLYWAGMVLNDVFDVEDDRRERPGRPIPSGRISLPQASAVGAVLLLGGISTAGIASLVAGTWRPVLVAAALALCIALYDGWAKRTPLGPVLMGACRAANVLVGMSLPLAAETGELRGWYAHEWTIAAAIGLYTVGFTWFARNEAGTSLRSALAGALAVLVAGLALIASLPLWTEFQFVSMIRPQGWYLLWLLLALIIARRFVQAIIHPTPGRVQAAVKNGILSLIVIDASIVLAIGGVFWGCAVLLLLAPAMLLGKWLYST